METVSSKKIADWPTQENHKKMSDGAEDRYRLQSRRRKKGKIQTIPLLDFKLHFTVPKGNNVFELLEAAEKEISSQRYIHNWDDRTISDPIRSLLNHAKHEMRMHPSTSGQYILNFSSVDRVCTINGVNHRRHVAGSSDREVQDQLLPTRDGEWAAEQAEPPSTSGATPQISSGRVIIIREHETFAKRVAMLILYCFCLRLNKEDFTFIRSFIQQRLRMKPQFREMPHLREISPSQTQLLSYQRFSYSLHLPYLFLRRPNVLQTSEAIDEVQGGCFRPQDKLDHSDCDHLYRGVSSILLTLAVPKTAATEPSVPLLSCPEALWTVLASNCHFEVLKDFRDEKAGHLTPLAQFVRAVCCSLSTQKLHALNILGVLRRHVNQSRTRKSASARVFAGLNAVFDDDSFTKTSLYHWTISHCHDIIVFLDTNIKFVQRFENTRLVSLRGIAHAYEQEGLARWVARMDEDIDELILVQSEVKSLCDQVQELREALHSATSLLESRTAVSQGERIQMLTYINLAYLPITTVASLYSMNVLPDAATLSSFFILLICILLATIITIANLQVFPTIFNFLIQVTRILSSIVSSLNPLRLAIPINLIVEGEWDRIQTQHYAPSEIPFHASTYTAHASRYPCGCLVWPLLFLVGLLQDIFFEWPRREFVHCSRLFSRPSPHPAWVVRFSYSLLFTDLLRLLLLPLWICWLVVALVLTGVWMVVRKIPKGVQWWARFKWRRHVAIGEEKMCFEDSD